MNLRSFKRFFQRNSKPARRPLRTKSSVALQLEALEDRMVMSTLPAPIVTYPVDASGNPIPTLDNYNSPNTVFGPQLVADPLNPNTLVEIHSAIHNTVNPPRGEIWGSYSFDRGQTWNGPFLLNSTTTDPNTNFQPYSQLSDITVTFDRSGQNKLYIVSSQHNATDTSGALVFNKFTLNANNGFVQDNSITNGINGTSGDYILYRWFNNNLVKANPAYNPYIAIDNNEPTYTDPTTGEVQTDTLATMVDDPFDSDPTHLVPKAIYVAWNVNQDHNLFNGDQDVSDVMVAGTADGGHNWTTQQYVSQNFANSPAHFIYANDPRINFSQGTPIDPNDPGAVARVDGGTMNIEYTDSLNGRNADIFIDQTRPDGGSASAFPIAAQTFNSNGGFLFDAIAASGSDIPTDNTFPIQVNFNAPAFAPFDVTMLSDLDVEINMIARHTNHYQITLEDPLGDTFLLLNNRTNGAGNTINGGPFGTVGLPDTYDLGTIADPNGNRSRGGLFFDLDAPLNINDPLVASPYVGHYQPEGSFFGFGSWNSLYSHPVADLNGTWTLHVTDFRNDGSNPPTPSPRLLSWSLHFTSNLASNNFTNGLDSSPARPATAGVRPSVTDFYPSANPAATNVGIPPGAVIAYDNTLGSFSPYQGRLYVAYTSGTAANPDIGIVYSDDNGATWSQEFQVNDDTNDNFSEGTRAQFLPSLAVDPTTGTVVVSYYDGRFDASGSRVATSLAASIDGGRSWSPSVFLNTTKTAGDFLTGNTINVEPIPGNQNVNGTFGFGEREGLIAYQGQAIPVYSTNLDNSTSLIRTAIVKFAGGPRVVSGDGGPVTGDFTNSDNPNSFTYNNTFAADGTRQIDGIVVSFDRPIDPNTLNPGDVTVQYRDPNGNVGPTPIAIQSITPINLDQGHGGVDQSVQPTVSVSDGIIREGDSGNVNAVFTVLLSQPQLFPVVVGFTTANGTALAGKDYVATTGTVTIPIGSTTATFSVPVIGDKNAEGNEFFRVQLTSLSPGLKRDRTTGIGRIIDDDAVPTITVGDAFVIEGTGGTKTLSFPIWLSVPQFDNPVGVNYGTTGITATAGTDFTTATGTFIFLPGQTSGHIDVVVNSDNFTEANETLSLLLQNPVPNTTILARAQATGTIVDDDAVGQAPTVVVSDGIVKEADTGTTTQMVFTATLNQAQASNVVINYVTQDGTATAPADYTAKTSQVTIPAGQLSATFSIDIKGDRINEGNQTFLLNLSASTPGVVLARNNAIGIIVDDDAARTLTIGDAMIQEGNNGTRPLAFPVVLNIPDEVNPVTVDYDTVDGTAVASTATQQGDYQSISNTLTFAAGQTVKFVNVTILGDIRIEPGDEFFSVQLSNLSAGTSFVRSAATGTIIEDDNIGTPATVSIGDALVKEGDSGTVQATFKVVLSQKQPNDVVIGYQTRDGSATAGQDYVAKANIVVIPKEQTEATFTINVLGDTLKEGNENFFVDLVSAPVGIVAARTTGQATIVDDDGAPSLTVGDGMVLEGDSGTKIMSFPVELNVASADPVSVDYTLTTPTGAGAAVLGADFDYSGATHTFTFNPGQTSGMIDVVINGDQVIEGNEIFFLDLSNAKNASIARQRATGTIVDDDQLALTVGDVMVQEGDDTLPNPKPAVFANVPVYLNAATSRAVTFTWRTVGLTATPGADYTEVAPTTATIPAGSTSVILQVPILYDTLSESLETFQVQILSSTNAARLKGTATVSIADNDQLPNLTVGDITFREGSAAAVQVPVYLSFPSTTPVTVSYQITPGPAQPPLIVNAVQNVDYQVPAVAAVTFAPGQRQTTINIPILDDKIAERTKAFTVTLTAAPSNAEFSNKTSGVVTLIDNDVNITIGNVSRPEGNGGNGGNPTFSFPFFLSSPSDVDTIVQVATSDGSGIAGTDYTASGANASVTIPAGQVTGSFQVTVLGNTAPQANRDFFLSITNVISGNISLADPGNRITGRGTIIDDDDSGQTVWSVGDAQLFEGNTGTTQMVFTIYAFPAPGAGATINFSTLLNPVGTATDGQDYTGVSGTATFGSATATTFNVAVDILGDQLQEGNETINFTISNPSTGTLTGTGIPGRTGLGIIVDDDQQVMVFSDYSQLEGNSGLATANVPVMLSNPSGNSFLYDFLAQDGSGAIIPGATRPSDYLAPVGPQFSIMPAGALVDTLPYSIRGDLLDEGNEDFTNSLRNPLTNILVVKPIGDITIVDDDDLAVFVGDLAVQEGTGGSTTAHVPVFLNAPSQQSVRVFYRTVTVPGSATSIPPTDDFTAGSSFIDIPAGATSGTIDIPINPDSLDEGNEVFQVQITNVTGAGIGNALATVTIVDDDLAPALTVSPSFLREQNGPMPFTVYSSFPVANPVNMTVNTSNGLATAGADYNALTNVPLAIAAGQTSVPFSVTIHDDTLAEGNEDFQVTLSNASYFDTLTSANKSATFAGASSTGTIVDDEPTQSINVGDAIVKEGDAGLFAVTIPIFLSGPVNVPITVQYHTVDDTAVAPTDYQAIPTTTLTIPANTISTSITVMVQSNSLKEGDHQFFVDFFNSVGATVAKPRATVTIVDDDSAFGATQFLIRIAPQSAVGTYSYAIGPNVTDRVQWMDYANKPLVGPVPLVIANKMDQNNNGQVGENNTVPGVDASGVPFGSDRFAMPNPDLQIPFFGPYATDTLPLIIPGPHVVGTGFKTKSFSTTAISPLPPVGTGGSGSLVNDTGTSLITVAGLKGQLADLNVTVNINYSVGSDLVLRLRAPNNQVVTLANQRGTGNAFSNTVFDDQAATSVTASGGPYTSVRPETPLSVLNYLDADKLNGTWTLEVEDKNGARIGTILGFSLSFTTTNESSFDGNLFTKQGNEAVPDLGNSVTNPSGTVFSNLTASGLAGWITDVNVRVSIDYPDSGDLTLRLHAPNGTVITLASFNGDGNFFGNTLFDDQAPMSIRAQDPNGPFTLVQPLGSLALFNGIKSEVLNGNWQLEIRGAGGVGGILKSWSLDIKTSTFTDNLVLNNTNDHVDVVFDRDMNASTFTAADIQRIIGPAGVITGSFTVGPVPGAPASMANRAFRITFPSQKLSGDYQINVGSNIQSASGYSVDTNLNAGLQILKGGDPTIGALTAVTYSAASPSTSVDPAQTSTTPVTIPANNGATPLVVTLDIKDQFKIVQGAAADVLNHIQLSLNISHSTDPDLSAVLIAPDGTRIQLFSSIGNFSNGVTFDDFAVTPVVTGTSTFQLGTLNPQIPLSRLQGKFTSGLWKLEITNNGFSPGTLNSWSLRLPYYKSAPVVFAPNTNQAPSGLGETVADQFTTGFRIFTMDATSALAKSTWTPVGPASSNEYGSAGQVNAIAVDPSDPSGNTVYIGAATGGVWKTTNFLTTNPQGPTYVPLTDLGPSNSLNIANITVIPRNNDPRQSILLVGTGDTTSGQRGIGLLRSVDGGATWQVIDSIAQNFDAQGNPLPMSSASRDHAFVQSIVNKIAVDPTPINKSANNPGGDYIVYIAVGPGAAQGLYRSLDTGKTWTLLKSGNATDVTLAAASASATGTLQVLYAGFANDGVYYTTSAPSTSSLIQMAGGIGKPNHRISSFFPPIPVDPPPSTPNSANAARIFLATPTKTGDRLADTFLQGWLYVLVQDPSVFEGYQLYLTKDHGDNWTRVEMAITGNFGTPAQGFGIPTNDENITGTASLNRETYGPIAGIAIDPNNPNVLYMSRGNTFKIDVSTMADPWAVIHNDHSDNVAGAATGATNGDIFPGGFMQDNGSPQTPGGLSDPNSQHDFFNMYRDPYNPFLTPSTFFYSGNVVLANPPAGYVPTQWANDGSDVRWSYVNVFGGSSSHTIATTTDPLTGATRLLLGTDQGVYTELDALSSVSVSNSDMIHRGDNATTFGIGSAASVRGSRNGNLQVAQFVSGAVQPSTLAADVAGSLFYGMANDNGMPASSADILATGNLNWLNYDQTRTATLLATATGANGSWVMTDPTGGFDRIDPNTGQVIFDPNRIGTTYQYFWPDFINQSNLSRDDFFILDFPNTTPISRTTGLLQSNAWFNGGGSLTRPFGRFAVNPLDPGALVISDGQGRIFRSAGQLDGYGILWSPIAQPNVLDGTAAEATAFGSPAANVFNLDDFIYAGTDGGRVFVTTNGGGLWRNISTGLDGSTVMQVIPNPTRGSNEVYAITRNGVYWMADSSVANPTWVKLNDTAGQDSLFNFTRPIFNNSNDLQPIMAAGQITTMAIDWRYAIPDNLANPGGPKHPVLYVGGNAGVFRSIDKGLHWTLYPNVADNNAPQEGGYLPNVRVTDLDLMLGYLNPQTGSTNRSAAENVLMATTYGRGAFAIRLDDSGYSQFLVNFTSGPRIADTRLDTGSLTNFLNNVSKNGDIHFDSPNPGSTLAGFYVRFNTLVDATTFTAADVTITGPNGAAIPVTSVADVTPVGGLNQHNIFRIRFAAQSAAGKYTIKFGPNITDFGGDLMNQNNNNINGEAGDFFSGTYTFTPNTAPTIQAIPAQVATPNVALNVPVKVNDGQTPTQLTLQASSSNQNIVPNSSMTFNSLGNPAVPGTTAPTLTITPGSLTGVVTITVTVTDPNGLLASTSFQLTVNNGPTLQGPIPDVTDSHANFPKINYVTLVGTDPDPGDTVTYNGQAYSDAALTKPLTGYVVVNATTGQVDLTPPVSFVGTYYVKVGATDGISTAFRSFKVTVTNAAPTLQPIANITDHHRNFPKNVTLSGSDADGDTLTYGAKAYDSFSYHVFQLDQSLGLFQGSSNYDYNKRGQKEKYLKGKNNLIYYILPDGRFFRFNGTATTLSGVFIEKLPVAYYTNPALLWNAQPKLLTGYVSVSGNVVTISPPATFLGTFTVEASVTDGAATAKQVFTVTVTNKPPFWNSTIGTVTAHHSDFPQTRTLDGSDPDAADLGFLTYSATAYERYSYRARQLDLQYGLTSTGNYSFNKRGHQEKYIFGAGNKTFYILPNGQFFLYTGTATGTTLVGTLLETFPAAYYADPSKIWNSANPTVLAGFVNVSGNQINFTPTNFTGTYFVEAFVSDGQKSVKQVITVNVTNAAPALAAIGNVTISHTQSQFQVTLNGSDPDPQDSGSLTYSAVAYDGKAFDAYQLDQSLHFTFNGNYQTNLRGYNERYFQGANATTFVVFPDGRLFRFTGTTSSPFVFSGTGANMILLNTFDASYWQNPAKLWNAAPPAVLNPSPVSVSGNVLTFTTPANFAGRIYVKATVADSGGLSASRQFKVFITNNPPVLQNPGNQNVAASNSDQDLNIQLQASDSDVTDTLTYPQPQLFTLQVLAYQLDQQLGLFNPGNNFYYNYYGHQEKWLRSAVNNNWYAILPNGELHVLGNLNAGSGIGPVVAVFDSTYYQDPSKLYNATNPGNVPAVSGSVDSNGMLHLHISAGFKGTFRVVVFVSDGIDTVQQSFFVNVS